MDKNLSVAYADQTINNNSNCDNLTVFLLELNSQKCLTDILEEYCFAFRSLTYYIGYLFDYKKSFYSPDGYSLSLSICQHGIRHWMFYFT